MISRCINHGPKIESGASVCLVFGLDASRAAELRLRFWACVCAWRLTGENGSVSYTSFGTTGTGICIYSNVTLMVFAYNSRSKVERLVFLLFSFGIWRCKSNWKGIGVYRVFTAHRARSDRVLPCKRVAPRNSLEPVLPYDWSAVEVEFTFIFRTDLTRAVNNSDPGVYQSITRIEVT